MAGLSDSRERILIVEDQKPIRDAISKYLAYMGYQVVAAGNGKEGLGFFLSSPFDLVITDMDMPECDGLTLASSIKERSPHTPVVLITGNTSDNIQEGSVDLIIPKPFMIKDLERTAQRFLGKGKQA